MQKPNPIVKRVCLIVHNPRVPAEKYGKLNQVLGWNSPYKLTNEFIRDLREVSYGYANYHIVETIEIDAFPIKADGFTYRANDYVNNFRHDKSRMHDPDAVDYNAILADYNIPAKINRRFIDEVWLHAFPWAGYYESRMYGPDSFWCNAPAGERLGANRRFVVMGFSYERGVGEMLESYGHRVESIMRHTYRNLKGENNLWERFIQYDKTHPQLAEVGTVHFAPNSLRDYDWGNPNQVICNADDWLDFPNLTGKQRVMTCADWGDGDIRAHHKWWLERIPHVVGKTDGISHNWWEYIADPNLVR